MNERAGMQGDWKVDVSGRDSRSRPPPQKTMNPWGYEETKDDLRQSIWAGRTPNNANSFADMLAHSPDNGRNLHPPTPIARPPASRQISPSLSVDDEFLSLGSFEASGYYSNQSSLFDFKQFTQGLQLSVKTGSDIFAREQSSSSSAENSDENFSERYFSPFTDYFSEISNSPDSSLPVEPPAAQFGLDLGSNPSTCSREATNAESLRWSEDSDEGRQSQLSTNTGEYIVNHKKFKTKLCRSVTSGIICGYEDRCQFAHSIAELRPSKYPINYKSINCRQFHTTGKCLHAGRCTFIHNLNEIEQQMILEFKQLKGFDEFLMNL
ncbi:uncharacterized protein LOC134841647 [Symsagittifera roscoffensis]|uniref:uncharacterized protein LOC134841647 n=1 Tax=Symsagittifera roscoffensis TaxID=84072 RepID=UPI00307C507E